MTLYCGEIRRNEATVYTNSLTQYPLDDAVNECMPKFLQPMQGAVLFGRGLSNTLALLNSVLIRGNHKTFDAMLKAFPSMAQQTYDGEITLTEQGLGLSKQELVEDYGPELLMLEALLIGWSEKKQVMVMAQARSTDDFLPEFMAPSPKSRQLFCSSDAPWDDFIAEKGFPSSTADYVDLMRWKYAWVKRNMPDKLNLCGGRVLSCTIRHDGSMVQRTEGQMVEASQPAPDPVGRNEPCPCGSGKKYKRCCGK
jgi:hypothetical protein